MNSASSINEEPHKIISGWFMAIYHEFYEMESTARALAEKRDRERSLLLQQKQLLENQVMEADLALAAQMELIRAQTGQISTLKPTAMNQRAALQNGDESLPAQVD
ncbi:hypothetical protein ARSEF4850_003613 [Beauveria asiatica]